MQLHYQVIRVDTLATIGIYRWLSDATAAAAQYHKECTIVRIWIDSAESDIGDFDSVVAQ